jgi:hypothetical protein
MSIAHKGRKVMAHNEPILRPNERLTEGQYLRSKNGLFYAVMQGDSNFVIYRGDWTKFTGRFNTSLWNTVQHASEAWSREPREGPFTITMQSDGNLVISGKGGKPFWALNPLKFSGHNVDWGRNANGSTILDDWGVLIVSPRGTDPARGGSHWSDDWWNNRVWSTLDQTASARDEAQDIEFERIEYDLRPERVKITPQATKISVSENCVNKTSVSQEMDIEMKYVHEWSERFSTTTSLEIGAKTTISTGIPRIVQGKVELSAKLRESITWAHTEGGTDEIKVKQRIEVPAHTTVVGRCEWHVSTVTIPYKGVGSAKFKGFDYGRVPISFEGEYVGKDTHDVKTTWAEVNEGARDLLFWKGEERVT